jgi:hypothetical protein
MASWSWILHTAFLQPAVVNTAKHTKPTKHTTQTKDSSFFLTLSSPWSHITASSPKMCITIASSSNMCMHHPRLVHLLFGTANQDKISNLSKPLHTSSASASPLQIHGHDHWFFSKPLIAPQHNHCFSLAMHPTSAHPTPTEHRFALALHPPKILRTLHTQWNYAPP